MNKFLIREDYANHGIYGTAAFLVMFVVFIQFKVAGPDIAAALSVLIGAIVWELYRKYRYDYKPDVFDVLWSVAGPCACLVARAL